MDTYLGFKICKYCDSYFSPEGTWKKDKEGNWICQDCQLKFSNEEDQEEEEEKEEDIVLGWRTRLARWTENPETMVQLHLQAPLARLCRRAKDDQDR